MRRTLPVMRRVCAALLLMALGGCSSGSPGPDRVQWSKDLAAQGITVSNWQKLQLATENYCNDDAATMQLDVAVALDGHFNPDVIRTDLKYVCPDRVADWDHAVAVVRAAG